MIVDGFDFRYGNIDERLFIRSDDLEILSKVGLYLLFFI